MRARRQTNRGTRTKTDDTRLHQKTKDRPMCGEPTHEIFPPITPRRHTVVLGESAFYWLKKYMQDGRRAVCIFKPVTFHQRGRHINPHNSAASGNHILCGSLPFMPQRLLRPPHCCHGTRSRSWQLPRCTGPLCARAACCRLRNEVLRLH